MTSLSPGLPKRNPGLELANAFSVSDKARIRLVFSSSGTTKRVTFSTLRARVRTRARAHASPTLEGPRERSRVGEPATLVTLNYHHAISLYFLLRPYVSGRFVLADCRDSISGFIR